MNIDNTIIPNVYCCALQQQLNLMPHSCTAHGSPGSVADPRGGNTGHIPPPRAVKRSSLGPRAGCSYVY